MPDFFSHRFQTTLAMFVATIMSGALTIVGPILILFPAWAEVNVMSTTLRWIGLIGGAYIAIQFWPAFLYRQADAKDLVSSWFPLAGVILCAIVNMIRNDSILVFWPTTLNWSAWAMPLFWALFALAVADVLLALFTYRKLRREAQLIRAMQAAVPPVPVPNP